MGITHAIAMKRRQTMTPRHLRKMAFILPILLVLLAPLALADEVVTEISVPVPCSSVTVILDDQGYAEFSGEGIQYLSQVGEPALPSEVIKVLLPPYADLSTVSVTLEGKVMEALSGVWEVLPTPPDVTSTGHTAWPQDRVFDDQGRDVIAYSQDLFPMGLTGTISTGQMRQWLLADIPVALFQYDPRQRRLYRLTYAELVVTFQPSRELRATTEREPSGVDRIGEERVRRITVNFEEVAPTYGWEAAPQEGEGPDSGYGLQGPETLSGIPQSRYAIITTNEVVRGSRELADFVTSKQSRGFTVGVFTQDNWGGGIGDTAAENLRGWLQANYQSRGIEYVLLIGNPHPDDGDVPMKMLWPRSNQTTYQESPSDYYYADLTGNWDLDGDGFFGEWQGDFGTGGVDRNYDVLVGRIPYYGQMGDLDHILAKIIAFENESQGETTWRRNALLPMKPSDGSTPGYHLGEAIKDAIVVLKGGWGYHRIYEQNYGVDPETIPCTYDTVTDAWNGSTFGGIFWWTHGSSRTAADIMDLDHAVTLDDLHPGFTFQASCHNARPEDEENLSYSLLKNGCAATIGATRVSWYLPGQTSFAGQTTNAGMAYEYASRLITGELDSGHSLYDLKQALAPHLNTRWMNFTDFNIYGCPATGLFSVTTLRSLTSGEPKGPFGAGGQTDEVTPPGTWRWAEWFYGFRDIDEIKWMKDGCGQWHNYAIGWHENDLAEYLMKFGGDCNRLIVRGRADRPGPVPLRIYIDGEVQATVEWNRNNNCNQDVVVEIPGLVYGTHAIAVEFAEDQWDPHGGADGDRNMYLDGLLVMESVEGIPSITGGEPKGSFGAGGQTDEVTPPGTWRWAEWFYGFRDIDEIKWIEDRCGERHNYAIGWHQNDLAEYAMKFGGRYRYLILRGIDDAPAPVIVNIYVDGDHKATARWTTGDGATRDVAVEIRDIPYGTHAIAIEFAEDFWIPEGGADQDRNLYLDGLLVSQVGLIRIESDATWMAFDQEEPDWYSPDFDDSGWRNAYAPYPNPAAPTHWICGTGANFIWDYPNPGSPNGKDGPDDAWFRKTFSLPANPPGIARAEVVLGADDDFEFYVNGILVEEDWDGTVWGAPYRVDILQYLQKGKNVFAIHARDSYGIHEWLLLDATIE
jgi:hypothetical protein